MHGLVPGIHDLIKTGLKAWMTGIGPAMTRRGLALQLRIVLISESMGNHDSGGHGCLVHRLRRRWRYGRRHCAM